MATLSIALKLTECLLEADKNEENGRMDPIPLATIAAENVLVRVRLADEVVDYASFMSCIRDSWDAGNAMQRMFALGRVFYEFVSGESPPFAVTELTLNATSVNSISIEDSPSLKRPSKKSQRCPSMSLDGISTCISRLEGFAVHPSLHDQVGNLLDYGRGDFRGDDV